jgi:hypothetical protein
MTSLSEGITEALHPKAWEFTRSERNALPPAQRRSARASVARRVSRPDGQAASVSTRPGRSGRSAHGCGFSKGSARASCSIDRCDRARPRERRGAGVVARRLGDRVRGYRVGLDHVDPARWLRAAPDPRRGRARGWRTPRLRRHMVTRWDEAGLHGRARGEGHAHLPRESGWIRRHAVDGRSGSRCVACLAAGSPRRRNAAAFHLRDAGRAGGHGDHPSGGVPPRRGGGRGRCVGKRRQRELRAGRPPPG